MRFQVTKVMDAIEQRLTTDITCAQAVVDLGEVVRRVDLDGGRPVNLVRIGMVVDALSRYLIDEGAMLYPVAERSLLSEAAFTAKERMVLSRWADDGLIEVVAQAKDRAAEVADLTGLPLITLDAGSVPSRFGWPDGGAGRVLLLAPRSGAAVLTPLPEPEPPPEGARAVGRAPVRRSASPAEGNGAPPTDDASGEGSTQTGGGQAAPAGEPRSSDEPASEQNPGEQRASEQRASEQPAGEQPAGEQHAGEQPPGAVSEESAGEESAGGEPAGEEKPSQAATPAVTGPGRPASLYRCRSPYSPAGAPPGTRAYGSPGTGSCAPNPTPPARPCWPASGDATVWTVPPSVSTARSDSPHPRSAGTRRCAPGTTSRSPMPARARWRTRCRSWWMTCPGTGWWSAKASRW